MTENYRAAAMAHMPCGAAVLEVEDERDALRAVVGTLCDLIDRGALFAPGATDAYRRQAGIPTTGEKARRG